MTAPSAPLFALLHINCYCVFWSLSLEDLWKKASEWFGRFIAKWAIDSDANFPAQLRHNARASPPPWRKLFFFCNSSRFGHWKFTEKKVKLEVWSVRRAHAKKKEFQTLSAWHISMINGHSMSCFFLLLFFQHLNCETCTFTLICSLSAPLVTVYYKYENRGDRERNREISSETGLTDSFWYSVCSLATSRRQRSQTSARLRGA